MKNTILCLFSIFFSLGLFAGEPLNKEEERILAKLELNSPVSFLEDDLVLVVDEKYKDLNWEKDGSFKIKDLDHLADLLQNKVFERLVDYFNYRPAKDQPRFFYVISEKQQCEVDGLVIYLCRNQSSLERAKLFMGKAYVVAAQFFSKLLINFPGHNRGLDAYFEYTFYAIMDWEELRDEFYASLTPQCAIQGRRMNANSAALNYILEYNETFSHNQEEQLTRYIKSDFARAPSPYWEIAGDDLSKINVLYCQAKFSADPKISEEVLKNYEKQVLDYVYELVWLQKLILDRNWRQQLYQTQYSPRIFRWVPRIRWALFDLLGSASYEFQDVRTLIYNVFYQREISPELNKSAAREFSEIISAVEKKGRLIFEGHLSDE